MYANYINQSATQANIKAIKQISAIHHFHLELLLMLLLLLLPISGAAEQMKVSFIFARMHFLCGNIE